MRLDVCLVDLDDSALNVCRVTHGTSHNTVIPPPPTADLSPCILPDKAWEAVYPQGSINPKNHIPGGFGFYLAGPSDFSELLKGAKEVLFSYSVMFASDWDWVKGGKLPGIFGGEGDSSFQCSGGRKEDRCRCFSLRLMWRSNGKGEIYAYMPPHEENTKALLSVPPKSHGNYDYGFSVGSGSFTFDRGSWITIAQRVKLNDPGANDGELQLWIDGKSVINTAGLVFHDSLASHVHGAHFQTFFGGHTQDWASPKDQKAWFTNVSGAVL